MKKGYLSQYFKGIATKTLSEVEANPAKSNQHEFNGDKPLKSLFGTEKQKLPAKFIYLNDNDFQPVVDDGFLTWYDARERHATRTEYRMYFPTTAVSVCASAGDSLFIGLLPDSSALVIIAEQGSTIGNQLSWLFGISSEDHPGFSVREELESEQDRIAFASRFILDELGIEVVEEQANNYLDEMLHRFGGKFPTTREFSEYARSTLDKDIDIRDSADIVLMGWLEREEILFRTLERYLIADKLEMGFSEDMVEDFIQFSLSVQNRRKSRAGQALENHLEVLFEKRHIAFDRTKITENRSKPDFMFPGIEYYHNLSFRTSLLTMLGVKSTCKDRWRQVLSEAERISHKHLLTLEAAISANQTDEMKHHNLQLVVPRPLHPTYSPPQQEWLMDFDSFIALLSARQQEARIMVS